MHSPYTTTFRAGDVPRYLPEAPLTPVPSLAESAEDALEYDSCHPSQSNFDLPLPDFLWPNPPSWSGSHAQDVFSNGDQTEAMSNRMGIHPPVKRLQGRLGGRLDSTSMPDLKLAPKRRVDVAAHHLHPMTTSRSSDPVRVQDPVRGRSILHRSPDSFEASDSPVFLQYETNFPLPLDFVSARKSRLAPVERHSDTLGHVHSISRRRPQKSPDETDTIIYATEMQRPPPLDFYYPPSSRVFHPPLVVPVSPSQHSPTTSTSSTYTPSTFLDPVGPPTGNSTAYAKKRSRPRYPLSHKVGHHTAENYKKMELGKRSFMDMTLERQEKTASNIMRSIFSMLVRKLTRRKPSEGVANR